jgi:hypothetical protein
MKKAMLSKSTFIKGLQCHKALYLHKHRSFLRDRMSAEQVAIFNRGTQVGQFAQQLFPNGLDCKSGGPRNYEKAVNKTQELIAAKQAVLYEAAFLADHTLIYLDALVWEEDGWHAYEIKSSKSISETYLMDAALQNYIIQKSGLKLKAFHLVHINPDYQRLNTLDIHELFNCVDVSEEVTYRKEIIEKEIKEQLTILEQEHSPKIPVGKHCFSPYTCDFLGHCWKKETKQALFELPALSKDEAFDIANMQQANFAQHPIAGFQYEAQVSGKAQVSTEAMEILGTLPTEWLYVKPLYFQPAIPLYKQTKPYEQVAYGYAIMAHNEKKARIHLYTDAQNNTKNMHQLLLDLSQENYLLLYESLGDEINDLIKHKISIQTLFKQGNIAFPGMKDYSFNSLYSATFGKTPWYKKYRINAQAAQAYEKYYKSEFKDDEARAFIETFVQERMKYTHKLVTQLLNISASHENNH